MRVTVVEPSGTGGLIQFAYQLCSALSAQGVEVTLLTNHHYELAAWPHNFSVRPVLRLWPTVEHGSEGRPAAMMRRFWRAGRRVLRAMIFLREWGRLTLLLRAGRPDVVQFSAISKPAPFIFLAYLRRCGIRVSQVCHEYEERDEESRYRFVREFLLNKTYRQVDYVFFLSETVRATLLRSVEFPLERTYIVPHGNQEIFARCARMDTDLPRKYGIASDEFVILLFGVIRPSKGAEDLLQAFAILRPNPKVKLLIVGYPTKFADMCAFRDSIRQLRIEDRVVLDPRYVPMEDVAALMSLAAVVVLPYRNATQSGVLHLAYTFAKPVVATKTGGLQEDVVPGRTGLLVAPGEPKELAAALDSCISDLERTRWMGQEARRLAETKHAWVNVAAKIATVYERAAASAEARDGKLFRTTSEKR